ncbi:MAG TPA: DUF5667 domain-containing protein [Actinomycetales bacterium]|nr:DUF5667 domain-containing protein [Actinomycetales bacterium]
MSVSQTLTRRRDADLLERALSGDADALAHPLLADDASDLAVLVRLAEELPQPAVSPDPAFVARLREQLVVQAARHPLPASVEVRAAEVPRTSARTGPRTLTVPRGGRLLAGLATMALVVAVVVGGLSTRALPGDALYPVKLMIGDAQVRLAGSDLSRGKALLNQVDTRLDELDALVAAGDPSPALVDQTLARASDDLGEAQRQLLTDGSGTPDPRALQALADAGAQATGRLAALRDRVPVSSVPAVDRLLQQLAQGQAATLQQLDRLVRAGSCTTLCSSIRSTLEQMGEQLSRLLGGLAGGPGASALGGTVPGVGSGATTDGTGQSGVPGTAPTSVPRVSSAPGGAGVSLPGASVSVGDGVTATVPGPTLSLPGATVPLPSVTVGLPGPTSTGLPLPGVTVPGTTPTVGGATIGVPGVSVGGDCVLGLGELCLGG